MTDQEWQEGIERALNLICARTGPDPAIKALANQLARELPLRIVIVSTNKDKLERFRVGPARDEVE